MKILVADDSKMARKMVLKSFNALFGEEYEVFQASNGKEAVALYKENKPDLVLLDLTMPILNGYDAIKEIIQNDKEAKIVVISADIQSGAKEKVLSLGALEFIKKPVNEIKLKVILQKYFNLKFIKDTHV